MHEWVWRLSGAMHHQPLQLALTIRRDLELLIARSVIASGAMIPGMQMSRLAVVREDRRNHLPGGSEPGQTKRTHRIHRLRAIGWLLAERREQRKTEDVASRRRGGGSHDVPPAAGVSLVAVASARRDRAKAAESQAHASRVLARMDLNRNHYYLQVRICLIEPARLAVAR